MPWFKFLLVAALIGYSGFRLTAYGDIIAEKKGWGRVWLGTVLMAGVTSLPELVTGVSSVTAAAAPDIALGDILGSCVFNLLLISFLDMHYALRSPGSIFDRTSRGHVISGGFAVLMIGAVALSMGIRPMYGVPALGHVGLVSLLLAALYIIAVRGVFDYERRVRSSEAVEELYGHIPLGTAVRGYALHGVIIVAAGSYLPFVGNEIARTMGWTTSLVGTLFVALATSLPEVMVTLGAAKLGAIDLAVGNIMGSNLFNLVILAVDDVLYLPGPLLARADQVNQVTATIAMTMTGLVIVGLVLRPKRGAFRLLSWITAGLVLLFALNAAVLFQTGG